MNLIHPVVQLILLDEILLYTLCHEMFMIKISLIFHNIITYYYYKN